MDTIRDISDLEHTLRAALPPEHQVHAAALARALAERRLDPALRPTLHALAGRKVEAGGALVTFGSGNRFGNVSIGDVISGDKITISLQLPPSQLSSQERRNRRAMIEKVRATWIDGVLRQSLANVVKIELGLSELPDVVQRPLNIRYQERSRKPHDLPAGTKIIDAFDEAGKSLLILGEPGAGKTTMLLELCRDLLERAERDELEPIPVILQLASWRPRGPAMSQWFSSEIATTYAISPELAQHWIDEDGLTLLLDGLDEVDEEQRGDCVEAINYFRSSHVAPIVVTSRYFDYLPLQTRLRLHAAVFLMPLSDTQVDAFLRAVGESTAGLRRALKTDEALKEVSSTPLMLNVLVLACADGALGRRRHRSQAQLRREIFDRYIVFVLRHPGRTSIYSARQVLTTLAWMARNLILRRIGPFVVELLDPLWAPPGARYWPIFLMRLTAAALIATPAGVIAGIGLMVASSAGWEAAYFIAITNAGLAATATMLTNRQPLAVARLWWRWHIVRQRWQIAALAAVATGAVTTAISIRAGAPAIGIIGTLCGLAQGLFIAGLAPAEWVMMGGRYSSLRSSLGSATLAGGLTLLAFSITTALPVALLMGQVFGQPLGVIGGVSTGLLVGVMTGLWQWLDHGGRFVFYHLGLRLVLWRTGYLPLRMYRFLDQFASHPLLRYGGGGYFFLHRLLKEHFAVMTDEDIARLSAEIEAGRR